MDLPADRSRSTSALPVHPSLREAARSPRRRRPTGAAPPLPYRLQTSGVGWLVAAVVLVGLTLAVFARGLRGPAVAVTVVDDAVVRWLAGLVGPGLVAPLRGLARIGSWWVLYTLLYGLLLVLLVLRRWRHLIVWWVVAQLASILTVVLLTVTRRPRPFGVDLQTSWGGWALPSVPVTFLTASLMGVLYTLVPEGRWRNLGKWVVAGLITVVAVARMALGVDAPSDVLVGVGLGVTIPLLLFRRFTPNEVYPVAYRRGRSAHLDIGGARGVAIRRALEDQLGLIVEEVKPFGLSGSAGSTPLRITVKGDPPRQLFGKLYAQSHLRSDRWYKLGRELLYGRLEDEKPFNTVRRLVQQEDYALALMQRAGLPSPTPFGFVELTPEREYLLVTEFFDGAVELGEAQVDDQLTDDGLRIIRRLWDAGLAHRDIKPANLLVRDGRMLLIDVAFVETRPSPWRQAVDPHRAHPRPPSGTAERATRRAARHRPRRYRYQDRPRVPDRARGGGMIARTWRGTVHRADADEYVEYIRETGFAEYGQTPGNRGAWMLRRDDGDRTEFVTLSLWDSVDAIRAFAGDDIEAAVLYPEDARYLVGESTVTHHQIVDQVEPNPGQGSA